MLNVRSKLTQSRYHVPEHLSQHIDYVTPGLKLVPVVKRTVKREAKSTKTTRSAAVSHLVHKVALGEGHDYDYKSPASSALPAAVQACGVNITVACWRALYDIPAKLPKATKANSLGLFEQGDYFAKSDIDAYVKEFG